MIKFEFPVGKDFTAREEMYMWLKENTPDAKYVCMEDRMIVIGVRLNEEDAIAFKLRFGL